MEMDPEKNVEVHLVYTKNLWGLHFPIDDVGTSSLYEENSVLCDITLVDSTPLPASHLRVFVAEFSTYSHFCFFEEVWFLKLRFYIFFPPAIPLHTLWGEYRSWKSGLMNISDYESSNWCQLTIQTWTLTLYGWIKTKIESRAVPGLPLH